MRVAIIAGLMAVGLMAGCGGAEGGEELVSQEDPGQVEQGVTRAECINTCDSWWYQCLYGGGGTPRYTCDSNRAYCISQCPPA
ncbi:hypothetical protein [Myxococcus qinghaiensis]|uniref:hypothetical protein n=1 Tax=Myxococcus qinghaiensis TaxID=2906758 RepID=UPI0020A74902|nr:hypothetical protein [Myxococcus qinghaiensis]MCP3168167.1 hypothetical protein [Myxococcus qinghaiensis]